MMEGSGSEPDPYLVLTDLEPDPGGPKTSGSATLLKTVRKRFNE
jgi:hypothetical protein